MNQIKQIRGFEKRVYSIDENLEFLEVDYKSLKEKFKYKIDLLEIGNEIAYEADNLLVGIVATIIFAILSLGSLAIYFFGNTDSPELLIASSIMWGALVLLSFLTPNKDDLIITRGEKTVRLFRNKPNEKEVMEFVNSLIQITNNRKKELFINFDLNEDQFTANIQWLRNMKLIDDSELENLKSDYKIKNLIQ